MTELEQRLGRAVERRRALDLPRADTNCYRLVHGGADELEGLTVDVYDRFLVASSYDEESAREAAQLDALSALGFRGVYLKQRPRQASAESERSRLSRCPPRAVRGESAPELLVVLESGVPFEVRLGDGFSTGLFLDQRDNRLRVRRAAAGKRVLNLFSYTCAFGVVAALGGAHSTTNVDVAKAALERGKANYARSDLALDAHRFLARDVLEALPRMAKRAERFDLVVLDPPSYASTKGGRFSVERDYPELVRLALSVLDEGGELLACLNHGGLDDRDLERFVAGGAGQARRPVRELEIVPPPSDHPALGVLTGTRLKSAWARF